MIAEENQETSTEEEESAAATVGSTTTDCATTNPSDSSTYTYLQTIGGAVFLRPLREMTILNRDGVLRLVALGSFLQAAVYSTDSSLVLFYIEEQLNVREDDIAYMFFFMGVLGVVLQGIGLQPLVYCLGERGLLIVSFLSGTLHNFLYGVARNKATITAALSLSQLTKLNYPILSSLASQQVGLDEQGRVQGALLALNALAAALGPVSMNWIYERTKNDSNYFGPGTMFLFASFLYLLGTLVVSMIPSTATVADGNSNSNNISSNSIAGNDIRNNNNTTTNAADDETPVGISGDQYETSVWEPGDLEEPLLLQDQQLRGTTTI